MRQYTSDHIPSGLIYAQGRELDLLKSFGTLLRRFSAPYVLILCFGELFQFLLSPSGAFQGDSAAYGFGSNGAWNLFSLTGHTLRNWPVVLVNLMLKNQVLQVSFLFIVSTASWAFLFTQTRYLVTSVNRHILCSLLLILAISPQVITWNSTLLSEGLSISLLIAIFALLVGYKKNKTNRRRYSILASSVIWLSIKPSNYLVCLLAVLFFVIGILANPLWRRAGAAFMKRHLKFCAALLLIAFWISILNWNQSNQLFQYQLDYKSVGAVTVLSTQNPEISPIALALKRNHEFKCLDLSSPRNMPENFINLGKDCSADRKWLSHNFSKWYVEFLIAHPKVVAKLASFGVLAGNSPFGLYAGSASIIPKSFSSVFFGERNYALRLSEPSQSNFSTDKLVAFTPISLWVFIFILLQLRIVGRYLDHGARVRDYFMDSFLRLEFLSALISGLGIFTLSVFSPTEWFRQTIQFQVLLYVSIVVALTIEIKKSTIKYDFNKTDN
jgi:hypothetical protein